MNGFFTKIILGAKDADSEDLINILFVVVVAIFYAIGGFVKAKAKKAARQEQWEEPRPDRRGQQKYRKPTRPEPFQPELLYELQTKDLMPPPKKPIKRQDASLKRRVEARESFGNIETKPVIQSVLNLQSPDDLKKAVLHYEILGKPVAFRD